MATAWGSEAKTTSRLDGIVLVIADGTSMELITAARDFARGSDGKLAVDEFPRTAFVRTYSGSDYVTDSTAAATAMARGIKAANSVVGMAEARAEAGPESILDVAKAAGWTTAVVTDDTVTGGTPASFLVEHGNRYEEAAIATKLIERLGFRADIVMGGGARYFFDRAPDSAENDEAEERAVARKNQARLAALPVKVFDDWESLREYQPPPADSRPILGVVYPDQFPFYADGDRSLRLKDMVEKTVALMRSRNRPFLLVIEAALPDVACHANQARRALGEVLEFDATIDWLRKNLGPHTLLLATTDHNNGGFTINGPPFPRRLRGADLLGTNPVTGASYLTWASGPGADREANGRALPTDHPEYRQPALIKAKASMHSGGDVWLFGDGPGSEPVRGSLDNTEIFRLMAEAIRKPGS